jgi:hypothetical protein
MSCLDPIAGASFPQLRRYPFYRAAGKAFLEGRLRLAAPASAATLRRVFEDLLDAPAGAFM